MPEHQQSRRVGPAVPLRRRCGFLEPSLTIIIGGIIYMTAALWLWIANSGSTFRDVEGGSSACMECR